MQPTVDGRNDIIGDQMQDRTYLDDAITAREACKLFGIGPDRFLRTPADELADRL